ncbi:hypothetical protein [Methylosarcina fibrata]|uniref:hypothetical protein n=1 Tax=Methylosarcina fibrata TaxID=105972 RepID=UPI0003769254|nr:hypothetical protein [Methylosarcina fibrata]
MNINLHIERLVLDGVNIEPRQRPLLQEALQVELSRLLTSGGLSRDFAGGLAVPRISAPNIPLVANIHPAQLGQQIARSIYEGIGHE